MQRLDLVKNQVASGHYNHPDMLKATASAVIRSQALHMLLDRYDLGKRSSDLINKSTPDSKLDEIRRRIDDGFYDDPNNLAELAERLIKKFGLE
jgi:hypothetical protein